MAWISDGALDSMKLPNPYTQRKLAEAIATGRSFRSRQEDHSASRRCNLFEQLPQILKHGVFFVGARTISEKEFLAQVQCLSLHCSGIKPIPYRGQESISVALIFCRVPCVINRSQIELIERYFRVPIELRDRIRDQPVLREEDQIVGIHAIV